MNQVDSKKKSIARLTSNENKHYEIFTSKVNFVMLRNKNDQNCKESCTIVPIQTNNENEENQDKILCTIEKEQVELDGLKPFTFRSFMDNYFLVNKKVLRKAQKRILLSSDVIAVKNTEIYFTFHDLRSLLNTQFPDDLMKGYFAENILGHGVSGSTYLVHNVSTLEKYALKKVEKLPNESKNDHAFEARIMATLNHPNIVKLMSVYDEPDHTFLFTEYLNYKDLLCLINSKINCRLEEYEAKEYFAQITEGIRYLHHLNICHRDIKCDNIFVKKERHEQLYTCKIGDFGLSTYDRKLTQNCGTLLYSPPEMLAKNKKYQGKRCDIWSLGVVLFCMLSGKFPFHECFKKSGPIEKQICGGVVRFRTYEIWNKASYESKHLICCMINKEPFLRYNIYEIIKHPWLHDSAQTKMNPKKRPLDLTCAKSVINDIISKRPKIINA